MAVLGPYREGLVTRAWDHTLRVLTDEEAVYQRRWGSTCSWPKCKELPTHEGTFKSVTGGAGRVNTRRKMFCPSHANLYRLKHKVADDCSRCGGGGQVAGFDLSGPGIGDCPQCKGTGKAAAA